MTNIIVWKWDDIALLGFTGLFISYIAIRYIIFVLEELWQTIKAKWFTNETKD